MKTLLLLLLSLVAAMPAAMGQVADQKFTVSGTVVDSISREGEPYATISIARKEKPGKAVKKLQRDRRQKGYRPGHTLHH